MKPILITVGLCMAINAAFSQNCNFYFLQNNKTSEITFYNKKGDESGKSIYKVTSVTKSGGTTTGVVNAEVFNKKGKSIAKAVDNIKCTGGSLMLDMKMFMAAEQAEQMKTEAKASDIYLSYPASIKVGDKLEDGHFNMDVQQDNGMNMSITINITDRNVVGQESVTTPAGTWNCFKITYKSNIKVKTIIGIPVNADVTEWFAPGFGVVKTESKGSTTVLTKFE